MRLNVQYARIDADSKLSIQSFVMTQDKFNALQNENELNKYLRSKLHNKGSYKSWSRFGSWTLENEKQPNTFVYAWAYLKGKKSHEYKYNFGTEDSLQLYDDVLLLQFAKEQGNIIDLANTIPFEEEQISGWLECVMEKNAKTIVASTINIPKNKRKTRTTKKVKMVSESENENENEPSLDEDFNDDSFVHINDEDVVESNMDCTETKEIVDDIENEDKLEEVENHILIDEEDDDYVKDEDVRSDEDNSEDECEDTIINEEDNLLSFEDYTYEIPLESKPSHMGSIWTAL